MNVSKRMILLWVGISSSHLPQGALIKPEGTVFSKLDFASYFLGISRSNSCWNGVPRFENSSYDFRHEKISKILQFQNIFWEFKIQKGEKHFDKQTDKFSVFFNTFPTQIKFLNLWAKGTQLSSCLWGFCFSCFLHFPHRNHRYDWMNYWQPLT